MRGRGELTGGGVRLQQNLKVREGVPDLIQKIAGFYVEGAIL